ncbi:hypothetical protein SRABI96_04903 [Peribacillus sp. Bi96]|uniref:hypothetical protein n=1 Tax=Peribacillus sp. Bi96 TaxID=2884273 RepID=UPI001DE7AD96|nr:hypothetical protein [Peribacillus sp. Bi96]CAH0308942.1 hypothetical protein SRABI96_04903 [Peribacillus sp. Bi96]
MEFNFLEHQEKRNLIPLELPSKKDYYFDLSQLENSFVSRFDVFQIANTFFMESVQLITNAISLFEKGYFDSAYYSLRQSLETALTMVYLSDLEGDKREKELLKWKEKSRFPMYKAMIELLEKQIAIFSDVKEKMTDFFDEMERTKKHLNKYVHKQGFNTFYVSRNHFLNKERNQTPIIEEFEFFLERCISAITVFRLCIDPLPVLLMDEEIYSRTEVFMTDAFSIEYIEKYVGINNIEKYKQTNIYKGAYDYFIKFEKRLPAVLDVTKNRYIDKRKIDGILSQTHILRNIEIQAVVIAMMSEKVTRIMLSDFTIEFFFTNTESVRKGMGLSSEKHLELRNRNMTVLNFPIDNAFISSINVGGDNFFIEHNQEFDFEEFEGFQTKARSRFNEIVAQKI